MSIHCCCSCLGAVMTSLVGSFSLPIMPSCTLTVPSSLTYTSVGFHWPIRRSDGLSLSFALDLASSVPCCFLSIIKWTASSHCSICLSMTWLSNRVVLQSSVIVMVSVIYSWIAANSLSVGLPKRKPQLPPLSNTLNVLRTLTPSTLMTPVHFATAFTMLPFVICRCLSDGLQLCSLGHYAWDRCIWP